MNRSQFEQIVAKHSGTVTASNDEGTQYRVVFPLVIRAANFYDALAGDPRIASADWKPLDTKVIVNL